MKLKNQKYIDLCPLRTTHAHTYFRNEVLYIQWYKYSRTQAHFHDTSQHFDKDLGDTGTWEPGLEL
jgi:hypothetical protein